MQKYKTTFRQADGSALPTYVQALLDRTGVVRTYYRRGDIRATLHGATLRAAGRVTLSPLWWDEYFHLRHGTPLPQRDETGDVPLGHIVPGSWDALIAHYTTQSRQWLRCKPSTRLGYRPYHMLISKVLGSHKVAKSLPAIEPLIHKKEFGDSANGVAPAPGAARQLRTTFGLLCEHARRVLKWIDANPVSDIQKPKTANKKGHHTWVETEVAAFREAFPDPASDARAFFEMDLAWGARASDLLGLGWQDIAAGVVSFTPRKTENSTGAEVNLPVRGEHLLTVLAHRPRDQRYFFQKPPPGYNQHNPGKVIALKPEPWSYTRLQKSFVEWRAAAGLPTACVIHGLRKLFATRMANAGASLQDIADALADTEESAKIYIAQRDRKRGAARGLSTVSEAA